jgi:hypothetical protein
MWLRSIAYRLGQVRQQLGFVVPLSETDHKEVAGILPSSAAQSLFRTMSPADQQHSLRVCRGLQARGCTDQDMLAAALLHDIGKAQGRVPFWTRPAIVIGKKLAPNLLTRLVLTPEKISPSHRDPIMQMNKITRTSAVADHVNEQNTPDTRRGRFIVPTADLSALGDVPCPDSFVNDHYRPPGKSTPSTPSTLTTHQSVKPHDRIPHEAERNSSTVGAIPCGRPARVAGRPTHAGDHPETADDCLARIGDRPTHADGHSETANDHLVAATPERPTPVDGRPTHAGDHPETADDCLARIGDCPETANVRPVAATPDHPTPAGGRPAATTPEHPTPPHGRLAPVTDRPVPAHDHPTLTIPKWRQSLSNAWYHANIGAELASAAGLPDRTVLYIRTHHQPNGPAAELYEVDEVS